MVRNMESNYYDENDYPFGYTNDMVKLHIHIRIYARFITTFVKMDLMPIRNAQLLISNYSQRKFEILRDGGKVDGY